MFKSIIYKEWIKTRWVVIISFLAVFITLIYIQLEVRHYIELMTAFANWLYIVQRKMLYYEIFKYFPLIIGAVISILQFVPEMSKNRMRLSYHLPISEKKLLLSMTFIGFSLLIVNLAIIIGGLVEISYIYYPTEIVQSMLFTIFPWLLGGIAIYFLTSTIILEPSWKYRIILIIIAFAFLKLLFMEGGYNEYQFSIWKYVLIIVFFPLMVLFPGHRFRKGIN
jgi:hypothetical protein